MLKFTKMRWFFEGKIPMNVTKILKEPGLDFSENRNNHY
jgi:hypothetical protein